MRIISLLLSMMLYLSAQSQTKHPYSSLKFDKVIMYDFDPDGEKGGSIIELDGKLTKGLKKQTQIDKTSITRLNSFLESSSSFNWATAACFDPHLGFVYYLNSKVVGHVTICLSCNRLVSNVTLPAQKRTNGDDAKGMSKSLRRFLNGLLKQHNFSNQIEPGSSFDS